MDYVLIFSLAGGVAVVLVLAVTKFALRWMVRLVIAGLLLLVALGGARLWLNQTATHFDTKPRPTSIRRASPDRQ
jgi:hypothetical protein